MFIRKMKSEGIAHLSYLVVADGQAAVIDPKRDCREYVEAAHAAGARVTHIFETHRNEDYVIGSLDLARRTGATIHHGGDLPFAYGETAGEGDEFELGNALLRAIKTPGHTDESLSYALADLDFSDEPVAVFTGDAVFVGDVGRADFFPDRAEEVAGLLYDSIFEKLLPLGDHVLLYPAHGAGSVCGSGMADREFSTLGYERKHNPMLQIADRAEFIAKKVNEHHYQPPYFRKMEEYNLEGAPPLERVPLPPPLDADEFASLAEDGMIVLDTRSPEAYAGAFLPGSLAIPLGMIGAFAGWYLPYDRNIGLLVEEPGEVDSAVRQLLRIGYDNIVGHLEGGMHSWEVAGKPYDRIPALHAGALKRRLESGADFTLLDVRSIDEFESGHLPGAVHIYVGELEEKIEQVPKGKAITTFCGSGRRAIIAASILKRHGYEDVEDCLGSMRACEELGCPITTQ